MSDQFTVLVVDDQPIIRQLLVQALRRACPGALALPVDGVRSARAVLQDCTVDALITDYHLPDGTGLDVLRSVQRRAPAIRAVVISADASVGELALAAGAMAFLPKPFTIAELLPLLDALC
jgi:DNA-binding NtrC family response regulator